VFASLHWSANTIATIVVAVFAGIGVVIAGAGYLQVKVLAGRRNPIAIKRGLRVGARYFPVTIIRPDPPPEHPSREVAFYVYNHSDSNQTLRFNNAKSRIVWPRLKGTKMKVATQLVVIGPHDGGNLVLEVSSSDGRWPVDEVSDETPHGWLKKQYWIWLEVWTLSRYRIRHFGRSDLREIQQEP
jgi:hypothetical protein